MTVALFGITNDALSLVVNLVLLFLVVLWVVLIVWTYLDARRRIADPVLVACATAASLFPFVGTIIYSILRPPELLDDRREREIEMRASELRVRQLEEASCPNCEHPIERTFLRCPNCRARIKDPCESCGKPIDPRWSVCPYCEAPVRHAEPPERRAQPKRRAKPGRQAAPERAEAAAVSDARKSASRSSGSDSRKSAGSGSSRPSSSDTPPGSRVKPVSGSKRQPAPRGDTEDEGARPSTSASRQQSSSRTTQQRATAARRPERGSE